MAFKRIRRKWRVMPNQEGISRPRIVTLCGSTKFREAYEEWTARLAMEGAAVFSVICFGHHLEVSLTDEEKTKADQLHLQKIALSDEVFVLDVDGYVGESTRREVEFARAQGVAVRFLSEVSPGWTPERRRFVHRR